MLILYLLKEIGFLLLDECREGCVKCEARLIEGRLLPVIDERGANSSLKLKKNKILLDVLITKEASSPTDRSD